MSYKAIKIKEITIKLADKGYICSLIDIFGDYESFEIGVLMELMDPKGVFFDIGANNGIFSLFIAKKFPNAEVHSFEPDPNLCDYMKTNIKINRLKNVYIHNVAVSDQSKIQFLYIDERDVFNTLVKNNISRLAKKIPVETVILDDFIKNNNIGRVDIMKMDVQGYELMVLRGAQKLFDKFTPAVLYENINKHFKACDYNGNDIARFFKKRNYVIYKIENSKGPKSLELPKKIVEAKDYLQMSNNIAVKNKVWNKLV